MTRERAHTGIVGPEVVDERQRHRQILLGNGHDAAGVAIDDWNRRTPIPLPGNTPAVEPVLDARRREPALGQPGDDAPSSFPTGETVEGAGVHQHAVFRDTRERLAGHLDDLADRQLELRGEFEITLVMRRDRHDRAGPVFHEHVVRGPNRDRLAGRGIAGVGAEEHAALGPVTDATGHDVLGLHFPLVRFDGGTLLDRRQLLDEGMLGGDDQVGRPENRIRPRREYVDLSSARRLK